MLPSSAGVKICGIWYLHAVRQSSETEHYSLVLRLLNHVCSLLCVCVCVCMFVLPAGRRGGQRLDGSSTWTTSHAPHSGRGLPGEYTQQPTETQTLLNQTAAGRWKTSPLTSALPNEGRLSKTRVGSSKKKKGCQTDCSRQWCLMMWKS